MMFALAIMASFAAGSIYASVVIWIRPPILDISTRNERLNDGMRTKRNSHS